MDQDFHAEQTRKRDKRKLERIKIVPKKLNLIAASRQMGSVGTAKAHRPYPAGFSRPERPYFAAGADKVIADAQPVSYSLGSNDNYLPEVHQDNPRGCSSAERRGCFSRRFSRGRF
jgi:hypothetical protein